MGGRIPDESLVLLAPAGPVRHQMLARGHVRALFNLHAAADTIGGMRRRRQQRR